MFDFLVFSDKDDKTAGPVSQLFTKKIDFVGRKRTTRDVMNPGCDHP